MFRSQVLAVLATLVFCASALALDEWPISKIRLGAPAETLSGMSAAGNGDLFLLHWRDSRGGGAVAQDFVVRINAAGQILDDIDIPIPLHSPQIVALGDGFLLVAGNEWLTVSRNGTVSSVQKLSATSGGAWASNGTLVFSVSLGRVIVYDASMHVLANKTLPLSGKGAVNAGPVVATAGGVAISYSDGDGFHVAFADTQATFKWMVTPSSDFSSFQRLATDGTRMLGIAALPGNQVMVGWLIEPDGTINTRTNLTYNQGGSLGWNGKWVWVRDELDAVTKKRNVVASTLENGLWSAPATLIDYAGTFPPRRAITPQGMVDVESATVATYSGLTLTNRLVIATRGALPQQYPRVASTAKTSLAIWMEKHARNSGYSLFATRLDANGKPLDVDSIAIADDICPNARPLVAAGNGQFLVTWLDAAGLRAARVSDEGAVLDKPALFLNVGGGCSALYGVAAAGDTYLAVWSSSQPRFARFRADGVILDPNGVAIGTQFGPQINVTSVASNGSQFLITWWQSTLATPSGKYTFGMPVDPSGAAPFLSLPLVPGTVGPITWDGRKYFALQTAAAVWTATLIPPTFTPLQTPVSGDSLPTATWASDIACNNGCELVAGTLSPLELMVRPVSTIAGASVFGPAFTVPMDETQRWFFEGRLPGASTFGQTRRFAAYTRIDNGLGAVPRIYITPLIPARHRAAKP
jgi:hypothetical protein